MDASAAGGGTTRGAAGSQLPVSMARSSAPVARSSTGISKIGLKHVGPEAARRAGVAAGRRAAEARRAQSSMPATRVAARVTGDRAAALQHRRAHPVRASGGSPPPALAPAGSTDEYRRYRRRRQLYCNRRPPLATSHARTSSTAWSRPGGRATRRASRRGRGGGRSGRGSKAAGEEAPGGATRSSHDRGVRRRARRVASSRP